MGTEDLAPPLALPGTRGAEAPGGPEAAAGPGTERTSSEHRQIEQGMLKGAEREGRTTNRLAAALTAERGAMARPRLGSLRTGLGMLLEGDRNE